MLSAQDLVRAVKDPRPDPAGCEERADVGKCMDWTGQSNHLEVDKRISSLYRPLSQPRVAVKSCLSEAVWDEERAEVTIIKNSGRQELGPVMPEEALFLLENNSLLLTRAAVPLSLQAAYSLLLSQTDMTLEKYLVYSKLTKDGFKLVRTNPERVYCDHPGLETVDQESEPDIDKNMIVPLHGVKLSGECSDWMQEIITDMADHIVGLTQSPAHARKRKADWTSLSPERNSKQPRPGSEVVTLDDCIAIDDDQEQEAVEDFSSSQIPKLYRNPFHEDSNSSEDEIIIEENVSVSSNTIKRGRRRRDETRNIENINKTNKEILSSIRAQVTRVREAEKNIPPIDDGPDSNLFSCEVCQISCNSEEVLKNHKRGKPHQKKLNSADKKKHSCDICRIECTDASSLVMHLRGKKHLKVISSKIKASVTTDKSGPPEVMILEENTEDDEDIEIISQGKSKEEILSSLPDCSNKSNFSWNNRDIFSFVPKNTIELKNRISTLDVSKYFQSEEDERVIQKPTTDDPIAGASRRAEAGVEEEEILVLDDDEREPVTRPFRGFYPATQPLISLPREGGRSPAVRQPTVASDEKNDSEESLKSLARRAEEWVTSRSVAAPVTDHVVDLGSSSSEDDDDDIISSSSDYSDDVAAHSELRYFKDGPLASLWTFENKVGPLISPEMAGSVREIFSRLRMNPSERKYGAAQDDALEVTYDVHLAENYKKNSGRGPSYRLVIQHFQDCLPSPRALSHLDQTFPDPVPFLFAVVSGGTVCFFNMERMTLITKDAVIPPNAPTELLLDLHRSFICKYGDDPNEYEYAMSEFLRMNGLYWGVAAMDLMNSLEKMDREAIIEFVVSCQDKETGGFRPVHHHDPHILNTLSAVQVAVMLDFLDSIDTEAAVGFVVSLQQEDGSFTGDKWGERDNRFCFCALATLSLLGRLEAVDTNKTARFVSSCQNFDGGFGSRPGAESHAGLIYTCLGSLAITGHLHSVEQERLAWWLAERQLGSGGLNGRPEKLPDVCYSWWVLASLSILGRLHWLDKEKLISYMLACQDEETGGFADRPGDIPDPFHTLFGIAGLSLLGEKTEKIKAVNPVFCMPQYVLDKHKVTHQILK